MYIISSKKTNPKKNLQNLKSYGIFHNLLETITLVSLSKRGFIRSKSKTDKLTINLTEEKEFWGCQIKPTVFVKKNTGIAIGIHF